MKISSFEYKDYTVNWVLEPIQFKALTLIVGASGVGKTMILKAILDLKRITQGKALKGVAWCIHFTTQDKSAFVWSGEFENKGLSNKSIFGFSPDEDEDEKDKPYILYEKLYINDILIIDRNTDGILFNGVKTVKLSNKESVINLLKEEDQIKRVHEEFGKILFDDGTREGHDVNLFFEGKAKLKKYSDIESIRNSSENLHAKLYLAYNNANSEFEQIKKAFMDVFPYIENLKMESLDLNDEEVPSIFKETPFIQIKEQGIANWIDERKISSGMRRTLMRIAELYLCADGTVILIDEFENSLGINCIDEVTNSIVSYKRNLQFVMTSHHPYIINNINSANWKVVTRKAGVVKNFDASALNIGKSKHEAFTQLINLDKYSDGVEV